MIEELDMHLLDLVQNARGAGATTIDLSVICDDRRDRMTLRVADDGRGMDPETLEAVRHGFFSSKSPRSVGLGIPLLRESAEHCDGRFEIVSAPGRGTTVEATFRMSHVDRPPFGDLAATVLALVVTSEGRRVRITIRCEGRSLEIDTAEISEILGDLPLQHPEVLRFLKAYIAERIGARTGGER